MSDVLEEVTSDAISSEHVERRVIDWIARIDGLYNQIDGWLPPLWHSSRVSSRRMQEELMVKTKVGPRDVPVLDLVSGGNAVVTLEPRGLWIVGANGRIDLFAGERHFVIVDSAQNFETPKWKIADFDDRRSVSDLTQSSFRAALGL